MRLRALSLTASMIVSGTAGALDSGLDRAAKRLVKDTAQSVAPAEAVGAGDVANESIEKAKNLQESIGKAPGTLRDQAGQAVQDTARPVTEGAAAVKEGAAKAVEGAKSLGSEAAESARKAVDTGISDTPKAAEAQDAKPATKSAKRKKHGKSD
ncbi:hypothetical protein [Candidatus Methylocalor cossyra]|uniref:Late embryogenesis abundant protein n=1 Tax=Candidatus Methylocalor cossyra TaxID=3108543 RepID=A0ABM9NI10_9GAMM